MTEITDKENTEKLLKLLRLNKKSEIDKYCRDLIITSEGFLSLILAGRRGAISPYLYECQFSEFVPEHLPPTEEELKALAKNRVGTLEGKAKKAASKVTQIFNDRRSFAAHLFYVPFAKYWNLFYFDQRDAAGEANHWKHGAHIHYSSDLVTQCPIQEMWNQVCLDRPKLPRSLHIRYDYRHNRKKDH